MAKVKRPEKFVAKTKFKIVLFLFLIVSILLQGCDRLALYHGLSEEDANAILVLLNENGIEASKNKDVRQNEIFWSISVAKKDMMKARELLVSHKLPRQKELGLTGVYKEKGLIPTPDEQKARFLLAVKGEIINSLFKIPEVVDADVILNIPTKEEFSANDGAVANRPTASVVVRVKPTVDGRESVTEEKLRQFVSNAVEGLNPRDVTVMISYLPAQEGIIRSGDTVSLIRPSGVESLEKKEKVDYSSTIVGLQVSPETKGRLKVYLLVFFVLLVVLSSLLIISIVQMGRLRKKLSSQGSKSLMSRGAVEGEVLEDKPDEQNNLEPPTGE